MFHILQGDALQVLRTMPDASVNCCVTSPPYYGQRDYGVVGQLGLERTYPEYVSALVTVFREVRRVLRSDGCLFLNLGDCYATGAGAVGDCHGGGEQGERWKGNSAKGRGTPSRADGTGNHNYVGPQVQPNRLPQPGLKPKDLMMLPHRVAIALQDDGWWVRQDNVWAKGNGMPESVRDRSTRAHEYVFHLSKSERYYYDAESISEPVAADTPKRYRRGRSEEHKYNDGGPGEQTIARSFDHIKQNGHGRRHAGFNDREFSNEPRAKRNKRSWWLVNTLPTPEAHFGCMPITLAEICVLASCPENGTVVDPFAGAGTTGLACLKNNRRFIGVELNQEYIEIAYGRARKYQPLLMATNPPIPSMFTGPGGA